MNTIVPPSTLLLTLLLAVGLFFFIKASVKDRIQQVKLISEQPEDSLLTQLKQYFDQRAYQVTAIDAGANQVTFQGFVRPSWFLAIFLSVLAACGIMSLSLVLSFLYPSLTNAFLALVLLAPVAGIFYWQKAGRPEQVFLKVETITSVEAQPEIKSLITVTAHRDELAALQQALNLKASE